MPRATSISEGDPPFGKIMLAGSSRTSRSCHSQPAIAAQNAIRSSSDTPLPGIIFGIQISVAARCGTGDPSLAVDGRER
jgi:hypothetical protein